MTMLKRVTAVELFDLNQQICKLQSRAVASDVAEALAQAESFVTMAARAAAYNEACDVYNTAQSMKARGEDSGGDAR